MAEDPCERRPHHTTQQQLCFAIICALRRQMKAAFTTRLQRSAPKPERSSAARIIPCKQLASRPATTAAALSPSQDNLLTRLFSSVLKRPDPAQVQLHRDRDELLTLLLSGAASSQAVNAYVDKLAGSKLPFQERNLGGGPWVVLHTSGTVQLWKATYEVGRIAKRSNTASQEFDPQQRSALNRAEYYGGSVWVTASGTYEPVDDAKRCPKQIQANISSGLLNLWGWQLALPIRGTGYFEVMYLDEDLRVFRSGTSYAVQVRQAALDQLRERLL